MVSCSSLGLPMHANHCVSLYQQLSVVKVEVLQHLPLFSVYGPQSLYAFGGGHLASQETYLICFTACSVRACISIS